MASRRETCETSSKCTQRLARVKRWGKSPPLRWRHRRQGKPRVVQGQIGGESRPGSIKPSGRLLDPGSDAGTRGMIAVTRSSLRELRAAQNPAYRLVRHYLFYFQLVVCFLITVCESLWPNCAQFSRPSPFSISRRTRSRSSLTNGV